MLGDTFELEGFFTWHLIMTVIMCTVWVVLFVLTVVAFFKGKIFLAKPEEVIQDSVDRKIFSPSASARSSFQGGAGYSYNKEAANHV